MTVANMKPAGVPMPLPYPTDSGVLKQHRGDRRRAGHRQEENAGETDGAAVQLVDIVTFGDVDAVDQGSSPDGLEGVPMPSTCPSLEH